LSRKPTSSIIHREDGGLVYSSIQNDGKIIHWCDKCGRIWISKELPEGEIPENERKEARQFVVKLQETLRIS